MSDFDYYEDACVGEMSVPRCPPMRDLPVEAYASDAYIDVPTVQGEHEMAVELITKAKVTKAKKTKAVVVATEKTALEMKLERLIELKVQLDGVKAAADEYEKLRKELSAQADDYVDASESYTYPAVANGAVSFAAKAVERKVSDMDKVFLSLGKDNFVKLAKITLTDLDKYLTAGEQESCVVSGRTGARKISVIANNKQDAA